MVIFKLQYIILSSKFPSWL